jgi:hypothetical protein
MDRAPPAVVVDRAYLEELEELASSAWWRGVLVGVAIAAIVVALVVIFA